MGFGVGVTGNNSGRSATGATTRAFTLVELLAVIAIIGLLSGLIVGLSGVAVQKQRESRIKGEHGKLLTAIEGYKAELGNYPPDNPDRTTWPDDKTDSYHERCGRNPLFYELSGAVFDAGNFKVVSKDTTIAATVLKSELGVSGIENSSRSPRDIPFRGVGFKASEYQILARPDKLEVQILATPLKGPNDLKGMTGPINPWYYDVSSTNRHNGETFDLWTEYMAGNQKIKDGSGNYITVPKTNVFGNWKE